MYKILNSKLNIIDMANIQNMSEDLVSEILSETEDLELMVDTLDMKCKYYR